MRKARRKKQFWDKEYAGARHWGGKGTHLALSVEPSEDLQKFLRWYEREYREPLLSARSSVLDLGCGNGRNLVYLAKEFNARGLGIDSSHEAIAQAKKNAAEPVPTPAGRPAPRVPAHFPLSFELRSIAGTLPVPDQSQDLVLDMMTSHFLDKEARATLHKETARVLKPSGWLFLKTFLLEDDLHAARMLREHPAEEEGSYIHPKFGGVEHVFTEEEIRIALAPYFEIEKITTSHRHRGPRAKRRSMCVYAQKK